MSHNIITILTTASLALHATLGCCAHHDHACQTHELGLAVMVHESDDHCSHNQHHDNGQSLSVDVDNDCGHQHDGGEPHDCDMDDCSFVSVQPSNDLELMLTSSIWCLALGAAAHSAEMENTLSLHSAAEVPSDALSISGSARAKIQVWRL